MGKRGKLQENEKETSPFAFPAEEQQPGAHPRGGFPSTNQEISESVRPPRIITTTSSSSPPQPYPQALEGGGSNKAGEGKDPLPSLPRPRPLEALLLCNHFAVFARRHSREAALSRGLTPGTPTRPSCRFCPRSKKGWRTYARGSVPHNPYCSTAENSTFPYRLPQDVYGCQPR